MNSQEGWNAPIEAIDRPDSLLSRLIGVLTSVSEEEGYTPDLERQQAVIVRLPNDLLYELAGHLRCAHLEQQKFARLKGMPFDEEDFDDETVLRGKVFEMLVAADPALHTPDPIAEELLSLMHDPERFGMADVLRYYRTPDGAYLEVDRIGNMLVVRAAAEAKLGKLNRRAAHQLSDRGFQFGLGQMAQTINTTENLALHGLKETSAFRGSRDGHDGQIISVAPDFRQVLIVPANRDTSDPASLVNSRDFDDLAYGQLLYLLTDQDRLTIKRSAFSAAEVAALTKYLYYSL